MLKYNCNDYWQYLYRSSFSTFRTSFGELEKFREERRKQIRACNHEFVLLKEGGWDSCGGFDSTDYEYDYNIVECVHCGVTNKYKHTEEAMEITPESGIIYPGIRKSVETVEFDSIFGREYSDKYDVNLISALVIDSKHAKLLYDIAKQINPLADNEKLVKIMHTLNLMETEDEKYKLNTIEESRELIIRYCTFMNQKPTNYKKNDREAPKLVKRIKMDKN